jgi:hypothetical protein
LKITLSLPWKKRLRFKECDAKKINIHYRKDGERCLSVETINVHAIQAKNTNIAI